MIDLGCGFEVLTCIVADVHPESSLDGSDCGGDLNRGALGLLEDILKRYRNVKVTLFVTPCHIFLPQPLGIEHSHRLLRRLLGSRIDYIFCRFFIKEYDKDRFDVEKSSAFNTYLTDLTKSGQVEIGIHGCFHFHYIPPYASEFKHLDSYETYRRIRIAVYKMSKAGIPFVKGFAPPGWGVNKELIKVLADEGFCYIAGSADFKSPITHKATSKEAGLKGVSLIFPSLLYPGLVNIPRNRTPHRNDLKIIELGSLLSIHMHIENRYHGVYLGNGITVENIYKLEKLLDIVASRYGDIVKFLTFGEVAQCKVNK